MKKTLAFLMAGAMAAAALVGCSAKNDTSSAASDAAATTAATAEGDWDYISGKGEMTIGITYFEPMNYIGEDGKLTGFETDVVTGNDDGYCNTPTGYFSITSRARNTYLNGPGYSSFVNYWMGFYGGCGIHDASWRSSYGGNIYKGNGSHGCVNTPYSKVQKIYNNTGYGTPVIVYD